MILGYRKLATPVGDIEIMFDEDALVALDFAEFASRTRVWLRRRLGTNRLERSNDRIGITQRLKRYFKGDLAALDEIPINCGGTAFQQSVWSALRRIPVGTTSTYGEIAASVGRPGAQRAVGAASGANPIAIVVPCHRVVGSNQRLTGYGGGLERKAWLLRHEGVMTCSD
jgi:O-6-methylguanine DNA methyltransferase